MQICAYQPTKGWTRSQFHELQDSCLLSFENIADISISFCDEDDNVVEMVIHRVRAQRARQPKE
jgi:hypothetical protein